MCFDYDLPMESIRTDPSKPRAMATPGSTGADTMNPRLFAHMMLGAMIFWLVIVPAIILL